ncbi:MAG: preprotein translocase subunit SecE [Gemmatimonadales bacterium]|nr:preprotein translocase subunit SecE [Gemmatimonadales bacterium]
MSNWLTLAILVAAVAFAGALMVWRERVRVGARASVVFLDEVRGEIKKVTWPDRLQLKNATLVILAFVAIVALLIGILDIALQFLVVTLPGRLS